MPDHPYVGTDSKVAFQVPRFICPKHGIVTHVLESTVPGYEGEYCMRCWLDAVGKPLKPALDRGKE